MPKKPVGENILAKFRSVLLDKDVQHTGFTMLQVEDDIDGNEQFEVHCTVVVKVPRTSQEDEAPDTDETDATKETKIDASKAASPNFLNKLK